MAERSRRVVTRRAPMTRKQAIALVRKIALECPHLSCARCERIRWRFVETLLWVLKDPAEALACLPRDLR